MAFMVKRREEIKEMGLANGKALTCNITSIFPSQFSSLILDYLKPKNTNRFFALFLLTDPVDLLLHEPSQGATCEPLDLCFGKVIEPVEGELL